MGHTVCFSMFLDQNVIIMILSNTDAVSLDGFAAKIGKRTA